jgi:hypothetical protein
MLPVFIDDEFKREMKCGATALFTFKLQFAVKKVYEFFCNCQS